MAAFTLTLVTAAAPALAQHELRGTVHDPTGGPLNRARIELLLLETTYTAGRRLLDGGESRPEATAATDASGHYRLEVPRAGIWRLVARAPERLAMQHLPLAVVESRHLPPVTMHPARPVRIQLVDGDTPVADAWVVAAGDPAFWNDDRRNGWHVEPRRGRTDELGLLVLPRASDEPIEVSAVERLPAATLRRADRDPIVLRAGPATESRQLEVLDQAGRPLAGVLVRAGEHDWPFGMTGADGRLRLPAPRDASLAVTLATADGRRTRRMLSPSDGRDVLRLAAPEPVAGSVLAEGRGVEGALVWTGTEPAAYVSTDAHGRFRFAAPTMEPFWLQAESAGFLPVSIRVSLSGPDPGAQTLDLSRPAAIPGQVVDPAGKPLADARLAAVCRHRQQRPFFRADPADGRTRSGPDGRFHLDGLRSGAIYDLRVELSGYAPRTLRWTGPEPSRAEARTVVLAPKRAVVGRIVDDAERSIAGAEVRLQESGGSGHRPGESASARDAPYRAESGPGGRFEIAEAPASEVDVEVTAPGFAPFAVRGVGIPVGRGPFDLGTLALVRAATVAGRVLDPEGEAVEGARVHRLATLERPPWQIERGLRQRVPDSLSRNDGRFEITGLLSGRPISLLVVREGYAAAWLPGLRVPPAGQVTVRLEPALALSGRVVDVDDEPIAGAEVAVTWQQVHHGTLRTRRVGDPVWQLERSDADGRFEVSELRPGAVTVDVAADGYVPAPERAIELPLSPEQSDELLFVLEPGAVIEGRTTTDDGEPIAAVRIGANDRIAARSDAEGRYRLGGVAFGSVKLEAAHPHYRPQVVHREIEAEHQILDWSFPPGTEVTGRVTGEDGAPIEGAAIQLGLEAFDQVRVYRARSAADGSFQLSPVAEGRYRIRAGRAGYALTEPTEPIRVTGEPVADVELVLTAGIAIEGQVRGLDFDQLARVRVAASNGDGRGHPAEVDYSGRYRIADLGPGDWLVRGSLDGGEREARARLALPPGAGSVTRDLLFGEGSTLSGEAVFDGTALAGASVSLVGYQRTVRRSVRTNHAGAFRFDDLDVGRYRLELTSARALLVHNQIVELTGDHHVRIELSGSVVSGRTVAAGSLDPVADALIVLEHRPDGAAREPFVITSGSEADGRFELPRVPPGSYRLTTRKDGFAPFEGQLEAQAGHDVRGLELELTPTRGLDLTVRLADGRVPPWVHVQLGEPSRTVVRETRPLDADGRVHLATVPAGAWRLLLGAPGGAVATGEVTAPGEPATWILDLAGRLEVAVPALGSSELQAEVVLVGTGGRHLRGMEPGGGFTDRWPMIAGKATVDGIPAGPWTIRVTASDGQTWSQAFSMPEVSLFRIALD